MDELVQANPGLRNVMLTLVSNGLDLDAAREIHSSIAKTEEFGLDEISYAKELLSSTPEKFNGAPLAKMVLQSFDKGRPNKITFRAEVSSPRGFSDKPSKISFEGHPVAFDRLSRQEILGRDIQFYWPNHEKWDGVTLPLVALVSDEEVITAYRQEIRPDGNVVLVPVRMTEEDAEITPVLIIGNEEIPYEHVIDDNVVILGSANSSEEPLPISSTPSVTPLLDFVPPDVYTLYLGSFRATQHYESWARGGSEFRMHFVGYNPHGRTLAETQPVKVLYINVRRRDIKKKTWFHFGTSRPLLTTWIPEQVYGDLLITEEDPAGAYEKSIDMHIGIKTEPLETFDWSKLYRIGGEDDIVGKRRIHKDFLLSTGNGYHNKNWTVYENGGIYYTLPIIAKSI